MRCNKIVEVLRVPGAIWTLPAFATSTACTPPNVAAAIPQDDALGVRNLMFWAAVESLLIYRRYDKMHMVSFETI
jgi:hypothetical protein